ncbi:MAG: Clp protease ClpS [Marinilabiliales bacterium]|nr:MAG: Clp protease ClpS [Marinilabiliales bacterium]
MNSKRKFEKDPNLEKNPQDGRHYSLILHNDDVHDFMYVIDALIDICEHDAVQAEQCTYLVHYRGECQVKVGNYDDLKEMYNGLLDKGLVVSIN